MILRNSIIVVALCASASALDKYCQLSCDYVIRNVTHTLCDRRKESCGPAVQCGSDFKVIKLTDSHRQYVVDLHNYLRNKVALGKEFRGKQPSATNMNVVSYNKELESIAQCWANTCNGSPLMHDGCRRTEHYEHVGQNLGFINSSSSNINIYKAIKELTMLWYDEVALFNSDWVPDTRDRGPTLKVGHYTQMIWAKTQEIGCGLSFYSTTAVEKKWYHVILVCNYGPGGNYLGAPMYDVGKPCTKCSNGMKPNRHYKGLCGNLKRVKEVKK